MTNSIYSPRLEYTSLADDPEMELRYAIENAFLDETLFKCFGYLFKMNDPYRMVFIINGKVFEMDVIIRDKAVTIIKGSFNDIKMYLVAKISKLIANIDIPENGFQYIQKRIVSILTSSDSAEFVNVNMEITNMEFMLKHIKNTGCSLDSLSGFRNILKRFHTNNIMKNEMSSSTGLGVKLAYYLETANIQDFALDISKLNLIHNLLEFPELNPIAKSYCCLALLHYHQIDYDNYEDVVYEIAEWIYVKYFKDYYSVDLEVHMEQVD